MQHLNQSFFALNRPLTAQSRCGVMVPPVTKTWNAVVGRRWRTEDRAPMLALAGVLLLLGVAETAREMANAEPDGSVASNLGYAVAEALLGVYIVAAVALVMGGLIYLLG